MTELNYRFNGSVGKIVVGLKTVSPGRLRFYLRETVGKLPSCATFGIGFVMVLGKSGLGMHDHIAHSSVIRGTNNRLAEKTILAVFLTGASFSAAYLGTKYGQKQTAERGSIAAAVNITQYSPAVLMIHTYDAEGNPLAQGSGFLITADGVGVTNAHVLANSTTAEARAGDGRLFHILKLQAFSSDRDVAVFQIGRRFRGRTEWFSNLPFISVGPGTRPQIGDKIAVISSPKGLENTVSDGIVSALRDEDSKQYLQITAPVSPGSSGAPVFAADGSAVGIVTMQEAQGQNLNFAIPLSAVSDLLSQRRNEPLDLFTTLDAQVIGEAARERRVAAPKHSQFQGLYAATVTNLTANTSAGAAFLIFQKGDRLFGCFGVRKPLFGSEALSGHIVVDIAYFEVHGPAVKIDFSANKSGSEMTGTYLVTSVGGQTETGKFIVEKSSGKLSTIENCPNDDDMNQEGARNPVRLS